MKLSTLTSFTWVEEEKERKKHTYCCFEVPFRRPLTFLSTGADINFPTHQLPNLLQQTLWSLAQFVAADSVSRQKLKRLSSGRIIYFLAKFTLIFLPFQKGDCTNQVAQIKQCSHQPEHEMHRQNPRKATKRSPLLTRSSNGVIDFRYMRSYVRYSIIIKSINPYTRVTFKQVSI